MITNTTLPEITKTLNNRNLIISGIITTAGITSLVLKWPIIGTILIIAGAILLLAKSKYEIYKPTGSKVKRYSGYFDKEYLAKLEKIVKGEITAETEHFYLSGSGSGRIDVINSSDKEFVSVQIFRFVPHVYEPATDFISFQGPKAKQLIDYLENCRKEVK